MPTLHELRESQTKLAASLMHNANKDHNFALEAMILRYRKDLLSALDDQSKKITAAADNHPELGIILNNLTFEFQALGRKYVHQACNLGFARALKDLKVRGWISKIHGTPTADEHIAAGLLMENIRYLQDALLPAMHLVLYGSGAPEVKLAGMKSRIASYSHYLWKASERSYIVTMKEFFSKVKRKRKTLKVVAKESKLLLVTKMREGGEGSGNHGHAGVPGSVGGSAPGSGEGHESLTVYHAASKGAFDTISTDIGSDYDIMGKGFYFGTSDEAAKQYGAPKAYNLTGKFATTQQWQTAKGKFAKLGMAEQNAAARNYLQSEGYHGVISSQQGSSAYLGAGRIGVLWDASRIAPK